MPPIRDHTMPPTRTSQTMDPTLARLLKAQEVFEADLNFLRTALASPALDPTTISDLAATTREKGRHFRAITGNDTDSFARIVDELDKLAPMATSLQALATKHLPAFDAHLVSITNELTILSTKLDPRRREDHRRRRAGIDYVVPLLNDPMFIDMVKTAHLLKCNMVACHNGIEVQVKKSAECAAEWREQELARVIRSFTESRTWRDMSERGRERWKNDYRRNWHLEPEPEKKPPAFGDPIVTPWETRIKHQSFR